MSAGSSASTRMHVAPDTHRVELDRLERQSAAHASCDPLNVQAVVWLFRAFNAAITAQAEELRPLGLSPSAFNVLMALHNTDGHTLEPCQIAQRLLISRPSVTGLLDTLEAKELLVRAPHPDDRRRLLVTLTASGLRLLEDHLPIHYREMNALLGDLSPQEQATLVTLLRRVRGAVPADFTAPS